uniref:Uncharacterized protein n=1 Tax=Spermophilus dauricus TaxID=99837 RepID=A0A8C9QT66_SPEDA
MSWGMCSALGAPGDDDLRSVRGLSSEHLPPPRTPAAPDTFHTQLVGFLVLCVLSEKQAQTPSSHVFWHLPVPGCISVCVHSASFESFPGTVQAPYSALLWLKPNPTSVSWLVIANT